MKKVIFYAFCTICVLTNIKGQERNISSALGSEYMRNGEFEKAQNVFYQLFRERQKGDSLLYFGAYFLDALARSGEKQKLDSFSKIIDSLYHEREFSNDMKSLYLTRKGWILQRERAYQEALQMADSAIDMGQSKLIKAYAFSLKGTLHSIMEDQAKGLEVLLKAERLMEEAGYYGGEYGITLMNIGNSYAAKSNNLRSRDYIYRSCQTLMDYFGEKHPNHYIIKLFFSRELTQRNDFEQANELLKECLSHFEEKEDVNSIIHCYHNLTDNSLKSGDFEKALNYLEINLGISKENDRDTTYNHAVLLNSLINTLRDLKRYDQAWIRLAELEDLCQDHPTINQWFYKDMLSNKAILLSDQADYDAADSIYDKVEKYLMRQYGRDSEPMAVHYYERADNQYAAKNYERALSYHGKAREFYKQNYDSLNQNNINMLLQKGKIYEAMGELEKAGELYLNAKKRFDRAFGAVPAHKNTANDFQSVQGRDLVYVSLLRVSALKAEEGVLSQKWFDQVVQWLDEAQVYYNFLVSELFQVENSDHLIQQFHEIGSYGQFLYYHYFQKNEDKNLLFKALSLAEMTKNYARRIILNDKEAKKYANIPDSLIRKDRTYNKELQYYESLLDETYNEELVYRMNQVRNEWDQFINFLESSYPDYYEMKYDPHTASGEEIQTYASSQKMDILYFFVGGDQLFIYLINEEGIQLHMSKNSATIDSLVVDLRTSMMRYDAHSFYSTGTKIFDIVLEPHIEQFRTEKLCIVPDKSLSYLNFETLPLPTNEEINSFKDIPYLLENYNVLYRYELTSAATKSNLNKNDRPEWKKGIAFMPIFENENYKHSDIVALPWSESLANYLKGHSNMEVFKGSSATKTNFVNNSRESDLLHFSTHAFTNDKSPMQSYLLFVGEDQAFDSLTALEIIQEDLDAELALLSACQTGLSEYKVGFGLQSLSWSFEYAGCHNFLVSLWSIDDEASTELLKYFYQNLDDGYSTTEALQKAKLTMLKEADIQTSNPYYWAGMIYIGEDLNLEMASDFSYLYLIAILPFAWLIYVLTKRKKVNAL